MLYTKIDKKQEAARPLPENIRQELGLSPLVAGILAARKMTDPAEIREFLHGSSQPYGDPFLLKDMGRAVERILQAIRQGEPMTIYGDYDVDGTSASSLLYLFLSQWGARVDVYIPRRDTEGYGLNTPALQKLYEKGTTLIITVDTGISGAKEVAAAPEGLDIIITDHHLAPKELPKAYAVINPNQPGDTYPCKSIAGVGVAFKLCQALYQKYNGTKDFWDDLIELVALGTVADMVSLKGENREIVRKGLVKMPHTPIIGLQALIAATVAPGTAINSGTIGFGLGPRINAAGRLDDAMTAVRLLTTKDGEEAQELAQELNEANKERQAISQKIFEEAEALLAEKGLPDWGIVLGKEGWHPGVIGIVASRLTEKYHLPSILLTIDGEKAKGSCRSIPPLHLYQALTKCKDCLTQFGGHAQAAGLTMEAARIPELEKLFNKVVGDMLHYEAYVPSQAPDYFVPEGEEVTQEQVADLEQLAPFGMGNPSPVLGFAHCRIEDVTLLGKARNHLKLTINHGDYTYKGLLWQEGGRLHHIYAGEEAALAFAPRLNTFRDKTTVDLEVSAIEAPYTIVDWRQENRDKKTSLNIILQKYKKTVVYLQDSVTRDALPEGVRTLEYGDPVPGYPDAVVLYDVGAGRVLQEDYFPLKASQPSRLYLLYNREDVLARRDALRKLYPDIPGLRCCYVFLRKLLRERGGCTYQELVQLRSPEGYPISQQVLQCFRELELLQEAGHHILLGTTQKRNMEDSPTFQEMQKAYDRHFQELNRMWLMKPSEMAGYWKQGR